MLFSATLCTRLNMNFLNFHGICKEICAENYAHFGAQNANVIPAEGKGIMECNEAGLALVEGPLF